MPRILVIDDDEAILALVRQFLSGDGHDVVAVPSGSAGLAEFDADGIALIITDLLMPGQDGIEVLMAVRQRRPEIPVIVMSGSSGQVSQNMLRMMPLLGAAKVLEKPFRRDTLLQMVRDLLG